MEEQMSNITKNIGKRSRGNAREKKKKPLTDMKSALMNSVETGHVQGKNEGDWLHVNKDSSN